MCWALQLWACNPNFQVVIVVPCFTKIMNFTWFCKCINYLLTLAVNFELDTDSTCSSFRFSRIIGTPTISTTTIRANLRPCTCKLTSNIGIYTKFLQWNVAVSSPSCGLYLIFFHLKILFSRCHITFIITFCSFIKCVSVVIPINLCSPGITSINFISICLWDILSTICFSNALTDLIILSFLDSITFVKCTLTQEIPKCRKALMLAAEKQRLWCRRTSRLILTKTHTIRLWFFLEIFYHNTLASSEISETTNIIELYSILRTS